MYAISYSLSTCPPALILSRNPQTSLFPTLGVIILTLSPSARWAFVPVGANEEEERSLEGVRNSDSAATCLESWELGLLPPSTSNKVSHTQPCGPPTFSVGLLDLPEHDDSKLCQTCVQWQETLLTMALLACSLSNQFYGLWNVVFSLKPRCVIAVYCWNQTCMTLRHAWPKGTGSGRSGSPAATPVL